MATTGPSSHPYRGAQLSMVVVSVVMTFLATVSLVLRVIGRFLVTRTLGLDDWLMIAGMLVTGGYLFEICYGTKFGMGLHTKDIEFENMPSVLQIIYAIQLTYNTIIFLVKTSIVAFYLRLATVDSRLRKSSLGVITFLILFYISSQTVTTLQCLPVKSMWDLTGTVKSKCINKEVYFYILAALNIVIDIVILLLPLPTLKNIKRSRRDKIVLFVIFGVGGFSCISSIIRLYTIKVFTDSKDQFFDGVPINTWSMIEINVAVICASVPAMKPLFTKKIRERVAGSRTGFGSYSHQMMPLSGDEGSGSARREREKYREAYNVTATAGGSEEHIVQKTETGQEGIGYAREFTVEESYVGSSKVLNLDKKAGV